MCECTPGIKTPYCGKPGCEWPAQKPYASPHEDGWYWVRKTGWGDNYDEWTPALWQTEHRSWCSARFSGIPDSEMIVGDKMFWPHNARLEPLANMKRTEGDEAWRTNRARTAAQKAGRISKALLCATKP